MPIGVKEMKNMSISRKKSNSVYFKSHFAFNEGYFNSLIPNNRCVWLA